MKKIYFHINLLLTSWLPGKLGWKLRSFIVSKYIQNSGKGIDIGKFSKVARNVKIGNHSGVGYRCIVNNGTTIGDHVMMGPEVIIYTQNHKFDRTDIPMQHQGMQEPKPVTIGNDVWIGARAIVLPGVTIGDGCIIGAGAIVSKDIPEYTVAAGNPAKCIKSRIN